MKVIQQTTTLLECKRSNWLGLIIALLLILGGAGFLIWSLLNAQRNYTWLIGLIPLAIGLIVFLVSQSVTLTIDKSTKSIRILRHNVIRGTLEATIAFADTREVIVDERIHHNTNSSGDSREQFHYFLIFQKHDGTQEGIDVTPATSTTINGFSTNRFIKNNKVMELGNLIASYVGVPCIDRRAPTFGEAANLVETVLSNIRSGQKPV